MNDGFFKELANVLAKPTYPEDEVALWKENKVQDMKIQRSKPDFMANERLKAELFGAAHPYGKPALTDSQIGAITREKTAAFARRALASEGATLVLTGDTDHRIRVWDGRDGRLLRTLAGHGGTVELMAVSPDGRTLVHESLPDDFAGLRGVSG